MIGICAARMRSSIASMSEAASGPTSTWTLLRSISSWVFVFATAGLAAVSAVMSSTFRPAIV